MFWAGCIKKRSVSLLSILALLTFGAVDALANTMQTFTWSGFINGGFGPGSGSAAFAVNGTTLTLTFTNTLSDAEATQAQVLTGLTFDLPTGITLERPATAYTATGSTLIGPNIPGSFSGDISDYWTLLSGSSPLQPGFGSTGISAVGDLGGSETFGSKDTLSGTKKSPKGANWGLVGPVLTLNTVGPNDNFGNTGPFIQSTASFTLTIAGGNLSATDITNITPSYGSDGNADDQNAAVAEPTSLLLLGLGMVGLVGLRAGSAWSRCNVRKDCDRRACRILPPPRIEINAVYD